MKLAIGELRNPVHIADPNMVNVCSVFRFTCSACSNTISFKKRTI